MADLGAIGKVSNALSVTHGGVISGVVHNASGAPTEHRVIALNKETLAVTSTISDATTGAYTLYTSHQNGKAKHFVIEQTPNAAYPARIFDVVSPN